MKQRLYRFIIYGIAGWMMEVTFTGLGSLLRADPRLMGWTYLWMFPIYGMAVFLEPIHDMIRHVPWWVRGVTWAGIILMAEYLTGMAIRLLTGVCPWDYGSRAFAMNGVMRLDYGIFWFFVGLGFERLHDSLK
jgi:uncharacterized membrane protein